MFSGSSEEKFLFPVVSPCGRLLLDEDDDENNNVDDVGIMGR